jgi:hypothetical protein
MYAATIKARRRIEECKDPSQFRLNHYLYHIGSQDGLQIQILAAPIEYCQANIIGMKPMISAHI